MHRIVVIAISLAVVLAGCRGEKADPARAGPPATDAVADPSSSGSMRGIAASSGGVTTFCECGAPAGHVNTLSDPSGELTKACASLEAGLSNGIYVELDGVSVVDGDRLSFTRLSRARALGTGVACDAPVFDGEFIANGNEPFWAIEVRENGIIYRDPSNPEGRAYPYALTPTATDTIVYATKTAGPPVSTLEIAIEPARCVDSMSGEVRSFIAHVTLDGRELTGCARAGVPRGEFGSAPLDELNRFAGAYPRTVNLWKSPTIAKRLETLLGPAMKVFVENMKVQGPLMKDAGVFYVTGNKPHQGGLDSAVLLADPASDTLTVILYVRGARQDFKEGGRDVAIPAEVVALIGNAESRH